MSYLGNNVQAVNNQGASGGDFDGVSILDNVVRGELALSTQEINKEARDINNRIILSDSPQVVQLVASTIGQAFTIDTLGYQSINVTTRAFAGGVTGSNDGVTFGNVNIIAQTTLASSVTVAANLSYIVPCVARYIRFTTTTAGSFVYTLRNAPAAYSSQNISAIGGAAVSATTAQLGMSLVNIGAAAVSATTGQLGVNIVAGVATSNGQTLGTLVTPLTVAATVVKVAAGRLYAMSVGNAQASIVYLKLYNATTVTLGTTSPIQNIMIPASSTVTLPINNYGLFFSTGICFAVTGGQALLDSTALTTASVVNYSFT